MNSWQISWSRPISFAQLAAYLASDLQRGFAASGKIIAHTGRTDAKHLGKLALRQPHLGHAQPKNVRKRRSGHGIMLFLILGGKLAKQVKFHKILVRSGSIIVHQREQFFNALHGGFVCHLVVDSCHKLYMFLTSISSYSA